MKIRPVGVELLHVDGQTDGYDEAISHVKSLSAILQMCLKWQSCKGRLIGFYLDVM